MNEEVPLQGDQVPNGGEGNEVPVVPPDMNSGETREDLLAFSLTHNNSCEYGY